MSGVPVPMPDGTIRFYDNDKLDQAAADGGDMSAVTVRTDLGQGAEADIPWARAKELQGQSIRAGTLAPAAVSEESIQSQRHLADLEDTTSTAGSFGRGLAEELSFGLIKPSEDQQLADSHYHGTAHGLGRVVGAVGPALIPGLGEVGIGRDIAELGGAAVKAREAGILGRAAELLPGRITAQAGAGTMEALGGGLIGHLAGGAVDMAGQATLRGILDKDVPLSGESILDSAFYGMAGAGIGYGVAKGLSKAGGFMERLGKGGAKVDEEALVERLNANKELTQAQRGTTAEAHGASIRQNLENDISLAGANRDVVKDVGKLQGQVKSWRESPFVAKVIQTPEVAEALSHGMQSANIIKNFASQTPEVQARIMGAYGQHLHNIDEMANVVRNSGMDVSKLPSRYMAPNIAARQKILSELGTEGSAAEQAAQRLAVRLTAGTERATQSAGIASGLVSRIPIVGKTLGKLAGDSPLASVAVLEGIMHGGLEHVALPYAVAKGAAKLISKAYEVPARGMSLAALGAGSLAKLGLPSSKEPKDIVRSIRDLTPQQAGQQAIKGAKAIGDVHPEVALAAGNAAANKQSALQARVNELFPVQRGAIHLGKQDYTSKQIRGLEQTLHIATDPSHFAKLWANGQLSAADLKLATQMWPAHVARAKALAGNWLSKQDPETLSRPVIKRLETLLGPDAVGARNTDTALAAQASIAASKERAKNPPKLPSPAAGNPRTDLMDPAGSASGRPQG